MNYLIVAAGLVFGPRGVGKMGAMLLVGMTAAGCGALHATIAVLPLLIVFKKSPGEDGPGHTEVME
jgi:hypothetical protein